MQRRLFPNQNALVLLRRREMHMSRPGAKSIDQRQFHCSVFPNFTFVNVEKSNCFLRKFSPDGSTFIAFSSQQAAVEIYQFQGADAAGELIRKLRSPNTSATNFDEIDDKWDSEPQSIDLDDEENLRLVRQNLFSRFFRLKHVVTLAHGNEQLNRECSLFTSDGRYLIVAASTLIHEEQFPRMTDLYRNNESITPTPNLLPEDYWIYSVDMLTGHVIATKRFKCDRIYLAHNQGICLYDRTLAVLSVQHQTIHLFRIDEDGHLIELQSIGRHVYDDDEMVMNSVLEATYRGRQPTNQRVQPVADPMLNGLKQRIMTYLYRKAVAASKETGSGFALRNYYRYFDFYRWLRMWRMQLLDENHLLIRYASEDVVSMRIDATSQTSFFVFYDIRRTEVLAVYESVSDDLLNLYERYYDDFRGWPTDRFVSTLSNSLEARKSHDRFKQTILNAKFGGQTETVRRVLLQLPISAQSFNPSPYLDLELFSYDDKWVSVYERPRPCSEHPIGFHGRKCGILKFQIQCGPTNVRAQPANPTRSLVAFIFHPIEPFAISVHRNNRDYVVNFHLRHDTKAGPSSEQLTTSQRVDAATALIMKRLGDAQAVSFK